MNAAQQYALDFILTGPMSENELMGRLQDAGVISDNCITLSDIAEADADRAIEWMQENLQ